MERLFYPVGNVKGDGLEKGGGIATGRYLSIDYSPPGTSPVPALSVSYRPSEDNELPVAQFASGAHHLGNTLTLERIEDGRFFEAYFEGVEKTSLDEDGDFETDGYIYTESYFQFLEQAADPPGLTIDAAQLWVSDGTGTGDAGDFFFKIHQGGDPGSDSMLGFDISTFSVAGFVKNDVNGLLTGGNAGGAAGVFREIATGNVFGPAAAGRDALTGDYNFAAIAGALDALTSGPGNIGIGYNAGGQIDAGDFNVAIGYEALNIATYDYNYAVAVGGYAANDCDVWYYDIAIGGWAMAAQSGTTASAGSNIAIGVLTMANLYGSEYCIGIGSEALQGLQDGFGNIGIGREAGTLETTAEYTVSVGYEAGISNQTGDENTNIGFLANSDTLGPYNSAFGALSLNAWPEELTGSYNLGLGYMSGWKVKDDSNYNIYIGYKAGPAAATEQDDMLYIHNVNSDTPTICADMSAGRVGILVDPNSITYIFEVQQSSATDPRADAWDVWCLSKFKEVLGEPPSLLDSFRNIPVYKYKHKPTVSQAELEDHSRKLPAYKEAVKRRHNEAKKELKVSVGGRENKAKRYEKLLHSGMPLGRGAASKLHREKMGQEIPVEEVVDLMAVKSELEKSKAALPKFKAERIGVFADSPNIPNEILAFDPNGEPSGLSLSGYIGWLHAVIKEEDEIIQELQERVARLEAA